MSTNQIVKGENPEVLNWKTAAKTLTKTFIDKVSNRKPKKADVGLEFEGHFLGFEAEEYKPISAKDFHEYILEATKRLKDAGWSVDGDPTVLENGMISEMRFQMGGRKVPLVLTCEPGLAIEIALPPEKNMETALTVARDVLAICSQALPEGIHVYPGAMSPVNPEMQTESAKNYTEGNDLADLFFRKNPRADSQILFMEGLEEPMRSAFQAAMVKMVSTQATFAMFNENSSDMGDPEAQVLSGMRRLYFIDAVLGYLSQNSYGQITQDAETEKLLYNVEPNVDENGICGSMRNQIWRYMPEERTGALGYKDASGKVVTLYSQEFSLQAYVDSLFRDIPMFMVYGLAPEEDSRQITSGLTFAEWADHYQAVSQGNESPLNTGNAAKLADAKAIGRAPRESDVAAMLRSVWPNVRFQFMQGLAEIRSMDFISGNDDPKNDIKPALLHLSWFLFRDLDARKAISEYYAGWSADDHKHMLAQMPKLHAGDIMVDAAAFCIDLYVKKYPTDPVTEALLNLKNNGTLAMQHHKQRLAVAPS